MLCYVLVLPSGVIIGVRPVSSLALPAFGVCSKHTLYPSRPTFLLIVPAPTMTFYSHMSLTGGQPLARSSGRFAAQTSLILGSSRHFGRRSSSSEVQFEHPGTAGFFWLLHPHIGLAETGFRQCQYCHVG